MLEKYLEKGLDTVLLFGKNILLALIIYFVGRKLMKWIMKLVDKALEKGKVEPIIIKFTNSILRVVLYAVLIIVIISILGIPATSFIAVLSTASLTVGLALQGSLSNLAGGFLILLFKPFRVGDYVVIGADEGVVTGIDIFYTRLSTGDNRVIVIPNGTISNSSITNVTAEQFRRVDINIGIAYEADIRKAKSVLENIIAKEERILKDKDITVAVSSLDASQVTFVTRVWVKAEDYWAVKFDLLETYKLTFDAEGIEIPFNQLSVTLKNPQ